MTDPQWQTLLRVVRGERVEPLPVGLIVDSPWLPGWAGSSILDYFADEATWLAVNVKAVDAFPDILFLPGFWSEFGMCTEPSAFGAKCRWFENDFPSVEKMLFDYPEIDRLKRPDCRTDGLLPFVLKRLVRCRSAIKRAGHRIRFAVARGPLNIASYLLGHTELLLGIKIEPEAVHKLLGVVTDFLVDWIGLQADTFDSIDGILLLDDLIGFLGDADFRQFALPYLQRVFLSRKAEVRCLHNDAHGLVTAKHLGAMGVNLFNFSHNHSLVQMRELGGEGVALLGNIPPRDVLAKGTPDEVRRSVAESLQNVGDCRRIVISAGGGTAPGTPGENLEAMVAASKAHG